MSNHTTKAQREKWIIRAAELMQMDSDTRMTNFYTARDQLMAELDISQDSARNALAHAARRYRSNLFTTSAAAVSLGSMTSERKAAASRANGKSGGRPKKRNRDLEKLPDSIAVSRKWIRASK